MKKSFLAVFLLFSIIVANAQPKPLTFTMAIRADNALSQKDLYKRGKHWFSDVFNGANKALTLDDPNRGMIVGKASFTYKPNEFTLSAQTKGTVEYQVKLRFNQGMYKYEITNFTHKGSGISFGLITQEASCNKEIPGASSEWKNKVWADIKSQAEANANTIIKSLITEISQTDVPNR